MGKIALTYERFKRINAQIDVTAVIEFAQPAACTIVARQASPSSTEMRLHVQNRYPSPLKRSARLGRPLFFCAGRRGRQSADASPAVRAEFRQIQQFRKFLKLFQAFGCWVSKSNQGEFQCVRHSSYRPFLRQPSRCQPVIPTPNAALSGQAQVQPSPRPQVATPLRALSLVARQACSATTQASASNNQTTTNQTNRAGMRRCAPRPFLMQDPQPMGWARGDLT